MDALRTGGQMQSKRMSIIEVLTNIGCGYIISVIANLLVLPLFGLNVTLGDSISIGIIFTVISIVRSYIFRRIFNRFKE